MRGSRMCEDDEGLFKGLPQQSAPERTGRGAARLRQPDRHQLGWHAAAIDDLVAVDHPVRAVTDFPAPRAHKRSVLGTPVRRIQPFVERRSHATTKAIY